MESPAALKRLARRRGGFPGSGEPIMIIRYRRLSLAFTLASAAVSGQALAGTFQLQEQSVSGQGTSWAGRASNVQDATIVAIEGGLHATETAHAQHTMQHA